VKKGFTRLLSRAKKINKLHYIFFKTYNGLRIDKALRMHIDRVAEKQKIHFGVSNKIPDKFRNKGLSFTSSFNHFFTSSLFFRLYRNEFY